ncbi:hypothetical protein [Paraburkholderia caballeronis]|uniref:Uncharacterized protein n=1 Tax=Paraburkholderia caballeronis TaxID=416943 RepID=A0A1H7L976_9BURK|nr:hypothetical protein [Paraburkholderia caballeronis]PXW28356.1 hypothetical protein C7403_102248 [Paraburkholderia caballeronis]PXX03722.1 hypothetical protein C7407_102248 [Paraburkholderia caballeronis]RAK04466.1 hypothetical protein C7409_102248 [Paraburkholderia caballeronis]SED79024.1 hypothetical protein SAMN05445871_3927 [Paraburkholderia caballeronis]SEK95529.1 hypothetical protein SAMN05192542_104248 [Paraburkholderia caballeronis]
MGGGGKGGKGGGGSGSIDVTSTSNSIVDANTNATINSTSDNDITSNSTNTIDSKATAQLQVLGLDDIKLKTDTRSDARTQLEMDLKPLQVDLCLKLGLERFPSTKICKPQQQHFALTLFGVEVVGFNYSSEQKTLIEDMGRRPFVVGGDHACGPAQHAHVDSDLDGDGVRIHLSD